MQSKKKKSDNDSNVQYKSRKPVNTKASRGNNKNNEAETAVQYIQKLICEQPVNMNALRAQARRPGGFVKNSIRCKVWPMLAEIDRYACEDTLIQSKTFTETNEVIDRDDKPYLYMEKGDVAQVQVDVERSLFNLVQTRQWKESSVLAAQKKLQRTILSVLYRNPSLHYYQGYHDVVAVLQLVYDSGSGQDMGRQVQNEQAESKSHGNDNAEQDDISSVSDIESDEAHSRLQEQSDPVSLTTVQTSEIMDSFMPSVSPLVICLVERISLHYLRDFMREDFEVIAKTIPLVLRILKYTDLELYSHLMLAELKPFFCTSWLLTWFAHDLGDVDKAARIYDVLLSSPPSFVLYLCAAFVASHREEILQLPAEFSVIHRYLCDIIHQQDMPFDTHILPLADKLYEQVLPHRLLRSSRALNKLRASFKQQKHIHSQEAHAFATTALSNDATDNISSTRHLLSLFDAKHCGFHRHASVDCDATLRALSHLSIEERKAHLKERMKRAKLRSQKRARAKRRKTTMASTFAQTAWNAGIRLTSNILSIFLPQKAATDYAHDSNSDSESEKGNCSDSQTDTDFSDFSTEGSAAENDTDDEEELVRRQPVHFKISRRSIYRGIRKAMSSYCKRSDIVLVFMGVLGVAGVMALLREKRMTSLTARFDG